MASPEGQQGQHFKTGDVITHSFLNQVVVSLARRVIGGGGNRVRRFGSNILIDHDEQFTAKSDTVDWFWARLTDMPSMLDVAGLTTGTTNINDQPAGTSRFGLGLEEIGWKFSYPFQEVFITGIKTYWSEDEQKHIHEPPEAHKLEDGRSGNAINTTEIQHRSIGGGDDQMPWVVWGVNIMGTYYPADFRPIPPGTFFDITDEGVRGQLYHSLKDNGGLPAMPVVRMREFVDTNATLVYHFHQMGSHDGGCAPVPIE